MSQNQEIIESKLCAYIDGELDADGRAEIEKHLEANPQHRRLLESLRATRDLLRWLPREPAPSEIAETLNGQLERSVLLNYEGEQLGPSIWPRVFAAAAIIVLTAGLGVAVYYALPKSQQPAELAFHSPAPESGNSDVVPAPLATTEESTPLDRTHSSEPEATASKADSDSLRMAAKSLPNGLQNQKNSAQLEQLAREVAENPGAFVASTENETNGLTLARNSTNAAQNASGNNALVLLVKSNAPEQTERQLTTYFREQQIEWRQAPLNGTAIPAHVAAGPQAQAQVGPEHSETVRRATRNASDPSNTFDLEKQAQSNPPLAAAQQNAASADSKAGSQVSQSMSKAAATTQPAGPNQVADKSQDGYGSLAQQAVPAPAAVPSQSSQYWQANTAPAENVYVCQMSRRQAEALSNTIGTNAAPVAQIRELSSAGNYLQAAPAAPMPVAGAQAGQNGQLSEGVNSRDNAGNQLLKDGVPPTTVPSGGSGGAASFGGGFTSPTSQTASTLNVATSQPAAGPQASDEPLNVVIMVEPSDVAARGAGSASPTTQPAPTTQVAPAAQSAPDQAKQ